MSTQVCTISPKPGSVPPASIGLKCDIRPVSHMAATIGAEMVRPRSDAAGSASTTSAIEVTKSGPAWVESWVIVMVLRMGTDRRSGGAVRRVRSGATAGRGCLHTWRLVRSE